MLTTKRVIFSFIVYRFQIFILAESVFARCLSAIKSDREEASKSLVGPENTKYEGDKAAFIEDIRQVSLVKSRFQMCIFFIFNKNPCSLTVIIL